MTVADHEIPKEFPSLEGPGVGSLLTESSERSLLSSIFSISRIRPGRSV